MAVRLSREQLEGILRHGEETYPHECCGILLGGMEGDTRVVAEAVKMRNANTTSPWNRFDFDPKEHLEVQKRARQEGCEIVGFYHSHPNHPARPSRFDLDHAPWPGYSYMIVSIAKGHGMDANSYELADDRTHFIQEEIETAG